MHTATQAESSELNLALQESLGRVRRCVKMLEDDYCRQSHYLHVDDVNRLVSRLDLSSQESLSVWEQLVENNISISGLGEESKKTEAKTENCNINGNKTWLHTYCMYELLSHPEEIQLGRRIRAGKAAQEAEFSILSGEEQQKIIKLGAAARSRLITSNLRLVISLAKRYALGSTLTLEDLVQEGIIGLFRAVDKYDPELGFKFSTYATWWISQSISRAIENTGRNVRLPSNIISRLRALRTKRKKLSAKLRRKPSISELIRELGWDSFEVSLLIQIERDTKSLDYSSPGTTEDNCISRSIQSRIESPVVAAESRELQKIIFKVLSILDKRSRGILILRFGLNGEVPCTLEEVGKKYGVTRERIRQLELKALNKISNDDRSSILREYVEIKNMPEPIESNV